MGRSHDKIDIIDIIQIFSFVLMNWSVNFDFPSVSQDRFRMLFSVEKRMKWMKLCYFLIWLRVVLGCIHHTATIFEHHVALAQTRDPFLDLIILYCGTPKKSYTHWQNKWPQFPCQNQLRMNFFTPSQQLHMELEKWIEWKIGRASTSILL